MWRSEGILADQASFIPLLFAGEPSQAKSEEGITTLISQFSELILL